MNEASGSEILRAIIDVARGQFGCEDLPGLGIDPDVGFAPPPVPLGAALLDQPLAGSAQPQARAVHQQGSMRSGGG
jgi:hypothetical protein